MSSRSPYRIRYVALSCTLPLLLVASASFAVDELSWPREIEAERGTTLIYQPQLESLEGNKMTGRAAVSVTMKGSEEPVFGAAWFESTVDTDRDERIVRVSSTDITRVRFPNATEKDEQEFIDIVEREGEEANIDISLDRVLASLAIVEQERQSAAGLSFDPPVILFTNRPSVLVTIDGEPRLRNQEDDLQRVINTPFVLVLDKKKGLYYLDGGVAWYAADSLDGPWSIDPKPPKKVAKLRSDEAAEEAKEQTAENTADTPPEIVIATTPTELLVSNGKPDYAQPAGTDLLYVSNTEADILVEIESQRHFVVLSGRWYAAKSVDGPWSYVAPDDLPATFGDIPPESEMGHVLVFVPGTDAAANAAMDAQIPQTAAMKRGQAKLDIEYDGDPQFVAIEGTSMKYAVNTASSVLEIDGRFYACVSGAWYYADSPKGPWAVSDHRPEDVDSIPPDNPLYNVKYVYVYNSTPEVIYVGYTPGYTGTYVHQGCVVYGTGWYYPYWYGRYYYPRPSTWGFRVSYNPWHGWSFGISWSNGPFTITFGRGGYGGYWGPRGYYPRPPGYRPGYPGYRPGYRPGYPGARPPAHRPPGTRPPSAGNTRPSTLPAMGGGDNLYKRPENRDRVTTQPSTRERTPTTAARDKQNNVYTDKSGDVYRRNDSGGWDKRGKDGWTPSDRSNPGAGSSGDRTRPSTSTPSTRPSTTPSQSRPSTTPSQSRPPTKPSYGGSSGGLNRDYQSRQQGSANTGGYQRSRGGSYGGSRGGGGRRR